MSQSKLPAVVLQVGGTIVDGPTGQRTRTLLKERLGKIFDLDFRTLKVTASEASRYSRTFGKIVEHVDDLRIRGNVVIAVVLDASTGCLTQELIDTIVQNSHELGSLYLLAAPFGEERLVHLGRKVEVQANDF